MSEKSAFTKHLLKRVISFKDGNPEDWADIMESLVRRYKSCYKDLDIFFPVFELLVYDSEDNDGKAERSTNMNDVLFPENFDRETKCLVVCSEQGPVGQIPAEPNLSVENCVIILFTANGRFFRMEDCRTHDESVPEGLPQKLETVDCKIFPISVANAEREIPGVCLKVIYAIRKALNEYVLQRKQETDQVSELEGTLAFITSRLFEQPK